MALPPDAWAILDVVDILNDKLERTDAASLRCVCRRLREGVDFVCSRLAPASLHLVPR